MPDNDMPDQLDIQLKRPDSYVVSLRLNVAESRALTDEARRRGEKLSTTIKDLAIEAVNLRTLARQTRSIMVDVDAVQVFLALVPPGSKIAENAGSRRADVEPVEPIYATA